MPRRSTTDRACIDAGKRFHDILTLIGHLGESCRLLARIERTGEDPDPPCVPRDLRGPCVAEMASAHLWTLRVFEAAWGGSIPPLAREMFDLIDGEPTEGDYEDLATAFMVEESRRRKDKAPTPAVVATAEGGVA